MKTPKAGAILWICCLQYFAAEAIAITGVQGAYNLRTNFISDLGAVDCTVDFCSRLHPLMNASFLLQGCLIVAGALLLRSSFPNGWLWTSAITMIGVSGLGVFVVGLAPEDVAPGPHYLGAVENFLFCNAGAALLGVALLRTSRHRLTGALALLTDLTGLTGLAWIAAHVDLGLGQGGIERITAYPFPLWIACTGAWLLRVGSVTSGAVATSGMLGRRNTGANAWRRAVSGIRDNSGQIGRLFAFIAAD